MLNGLLGGLVGISLMAMGVAGCESSGGHKSGTHTMPDGTTMSGTSHAVMCPKCETVWTTYDAPGGKPNRMARKGAMECPECDKMATAYMKDGEKVLHNCPDCKVTPVEIKKTSPNPKGGHP